MSVQESLHKTTHTHKHTAQHMWDPRGVGPTQPRTHVGGSYPPSSSSSLSGQKARQQSGNSRPPPTETSQHSPETSPEPHWNLAGALTGEPPSPATPADTHGQQKITDRGKKAPTEPKTHQETCTAPPGAGEDNRNRKDPPEPPYCTHSLPLLQKVAGGNPKPNQKEPPFYRAPRAFK